MPRPPSEVTLTRANAIVEELRASAQHAAEAHRLLLGWYCAEHQIERPGRALGDPFALDVDTFVAELRRARGQRRPLSPGEVRAARAAWTETVAPMQERLRGAERLERELSDLVNAAYGLTPDEVRLMWETAPPRMPLLRPPAGADAAAVP
jgi:hypothetical protein